MVARTGQVYHPDRQKLEFAVLRILIKEARYFQIIFLVAGGGKERNIHSTIQEDLVLTRTRFTILRRILAYFAVLEKNKQQRSSI